MKTITPAEILSFWFQETEEKQWFSATKHFDELIRQRFSGLIQQAAAAELFTWRSTLEGRLAEIIVLDQFPRNAYRHTPQAFAQDAMALTLAQEAIAAGALDSLNQKQRGFLLLPYMHSESKQIHIVAETLHRDFASKSSYRYELRHKAIIDRFGRYPRRNKILGRISTPEEQAFLRQPLSHFYQHLEKDQNGWNKI
ncbi:hypothetical protein Nstercoris_00262 [Nitrosomonas stercoris]|uniref:DUF924 domain-containing protein n=1 Tax=Nitrosomonas stercoris TaxID=1444684 RepID=A0A4Y1YM92_9PROT|nr:hypothetical protein Nstercoris_00262 [Nitrosomonas stercoris]